MNPLKFSHMFICAALAFLITSCGAGNQNTTGTDTSSTDTTAAVPPVETNTTITTPQSMMTVKHKVADFAKWKASYDAHDSMRLASGIHSYVIGRGMKDSNIVLVTVKTDDMDKAKAFAKDPGLKKAMQKGGVVGAPSMSFVTIMFQDTAVISTDLRSRATFSVKDWNTWLTAFKDGEQERLDNGLTVRAYGHDADDEHKVTVVTALMDTAKAFAYFKSDMMKKRMAAGGVISEPERFIYHIVQRY